MRCRGDADEMQARCTGDAREGQGVHKERWEGGALSPDRVGDDVDDGGVEDGAGEVAQPLNLVLPKESEDGSQWARKRAIAARTTSHNSRRAPQRPR